MPRRSSSILGACWATTFGCADERAELLSDEPCAVLITPEAASVAVVRLATEDVELSGVFTCSAAVIAPNLVLTAAHCVSRQVPGLFDCDEGNGWSLDEDGSGRGRLGEVYPAEAVSVRRPTPEGSFERAAGAAQVIAFGAPTRCADNLAAVVLDQPLDIQPLPLRFEGVTVEGEALRLSGFAPFGSARRSAGLTVMHVAAELSSVEAPAGALRLDGGACNSDLGGAIYSEATGALVALPFAATEGDCEAPGAQSVALELSRYARFIERVAEEAGTELRGEATPDAPPGDEHCTAP
jgi:hypothetical protein